MTTPTASTNLSSPLTWPAHPTGATSSDPDRPSSAALMQPVLDPFAGLTETDAQRIAAALTAAVTESTRTVYAHHWRGWERWCTDRGIAPLPAAPAAVCAYLAHRATEDVSASAIDGACSAISYVHRSHGHPDPIQNEALRQVRRGLRRTLGTAPRRLARPLTTGDIRQIVGAIDRGSLKGARDAAIILLGYASALRRSELTGLTLADLERQPAGLLLHVRRSKTDPEGHGHLVPVAHGRHPGTDPVAALDAWLQLRGTTPGPVFVSLRHGDLTHDPISGEAIARMLRSRARGAGLSPERITGHSLRAGHATAAAAAGVPLDRIALQTRHRRIATLIDRYIRPAQALDVTSSKDLGL
ncbi:MULTISPECIES: tyrosine-type recombinase/integrase [unclassified Nocardioides]|uniref:tyrosine-type recombinase/integrase n=1 Tax=unclassified Nocardioides TaxID=2615069 RepID=UPI003616C90F